MVDEEDITRMRESKISRENVWIARAAWEALQVSHKTWRPLRTTDIALLESGHPTGLISDAVARGNLSRVHGLLRSMGAFEHSGGQHEDTLSQVSIAVHGAAVADPQNISGASIVPTQDLDYKTLCLAAYFHSRIRMALLDASNTISISTLSECFRSLRTETPVIEATTAGKASVNGNLCSASQETKSVEINDLVDVLAPGESRPMADQSQGRIALSAMVPVRHDGVRGIYDMADAPPFTFTGAKSSAVACSHRVKIAARHGRARGVLAPKRKLTTTSRNRARTPQRLSCPASSVTIAQRPLRQANEPAVPILETNSPLAALPLQQTKRTEVPVHGATTADIGRAEVMEAMPIPSAQARNKCRAMQTVVRGTLLLTGQAYSMNTGAGYPFAPARILRDVACLALGDGALLNIAKDSMVLSAAVPSVSYSSAGVQLAREGWLHELERHRKTRLEAALRTGCFETLRALLDDTARTYVHDEPGGNPLQVDRYSNCSRKMAEQCFLHPGVPERATYTAKNEFSPLVRSGSVFDNPNLLQRGPAAHVPKHTAVSLRQDSVARGSARLARTCIPPILRVRVAKLLVLREVRAVHKLVNAVHLDDEAAIRRQFAGGAPIAAERVGCLRLLHKAAEANSHRAIAALLGAGCDANVLDSAGVSPLHVATEHGFGVVTKMLLDANVDCQVIDANGESALVKAARGRHDDVVKILLEAGANPNSCDEFGDTPLHLAARHGDCRMIERLAQFGPVDVNALNDKQQSALYMAVKNGDTDSITILLGIGASITAGFGSHGSAVYLAAHLGLQNCLDVIVDHDYDGGKAIDLEGEETPSPLLRAVQYQDADAVVMLLNRGACVSKKYCNDNTILHISSDANSVEWLTKFGARGNGRNRWNCTPLHIAVIDEKRDVLEALLKAGVRVDIDAKTDEGMTALHYAVQHGDAHTVKALLKNGADYRARNKGRATALHMAVALGLLDAVKALLGHGVQATRAVGKSEPTPPKTASCGKSNAKPLPVPSKRPATASRKKKRKGKGGLKDLRSAEQEAKVSAPCSNCVNSSNDIGESPLHIAASIGNIEVAQELLASGARPQAIDKRGATPLHNAVLCGYHDIVMVLLAGGANVGRANDEGKTALHIACDFDGLLSLATIDALIAHGASAACEESNGCTPLHVAILSLDQSKVVSAAAEPQAQPSSISDNGSKKESTPLYASVNKCGEEVVEFLLHHGAPVDAKNHQGKSPLRLACEKGHFGIARILLRAGASPGVGGEKGITLLHTACSRGNIEMVKLLLGAGALPGHSYNSRGVSPLHVAAEWAHPDAVKALLPRLNERQIDMRCKAGMTPLIVAVKRRDKDTVAALLKAGADPTARTPEDRPPLSVIAGLASNSDSADIVRSLLKRGAPPDAFCMDGLFPLHIACEAGGDAGVVQALLAGGAEINSPCPGEDFLLPLHLAARSGHAEAARALATTAGCRLHDKANDGATALTMAISNGHTETVRALLESGALLEESVVDENGTDIGSHVHVAIVNGHADTCRLLLQATVESRARDVQPSHG